MGGHKEPDDSGELKEIGGKARLFTDGALQPGARVVPSDSQTHYLLHVMRARNGDRVLLFNGRDGEWRAALFEVGRHRCALICEVQTRPQKSVPDLWLAFAPVKKTPAEFLTQKATELGVAALIPVVTDRTIARRVNLDRLRANSFEAAEQSERLDVPEIREPVTLEHLLRGWPTTRRLLFCDEAGEAAPIAGALMHAPRGVPWGVLTGPEGGFTPGERKLVRQHSAVLPVTLGPRIMRADTAALAALAVWQAILGDWRSVPSGL